jgi:hypothetical protein
MCGVRVRLVRRAGEHRGGHLLGAALVQEHHERFTPCSLRSLSTSDVDGGHLGPDSRPTTPLGVTTVGVPSNVSPTKAIFALPTLRIS